MNNSVSQTLFPIIKLLRIDNINNTKHQNREWADKEV